MPNKELEPGDVLVSHSLINSEITDKDIDIPVGARAIVMCAEPILAIQVYSSQHAKSRIVLTFDTNDDVYNHFKLATDLDTSDTLEGWSVSISEHRAVTVGIIKFDLYLNDRPVGYISYSSGEQAVALFKTDVSDNESAGAKLERIVESLLPHAKGLKHHDLNITLREHILLLVMTYLAQGLNKGAISVENYIRFIANNTNYTEPMNAPSNLYC